MSIDRCCECDRQVDTDDDDEAYGDGDEECVCHSCRERLAEEQAEDHRLDDPRHGQARDLNRGRY